jgi:hypothetical protein
MDPMQNALLFPFLLKFHTEVSQIMNLSFDPSTWLDYWLLLFFLQADIWALNFSLV